MPILTILKYPNEVLRQKAKKIKNPLESEVQKLVSDMTETLLQKNNGLGLAAPQVGKPLRLFIILNEGKINTFINPQIKSYSKEKSVVEEGCLSFPGKFMPVERPIKIKVRYLDETGKNCKIKAEGLLARAIQHETDHLNGVLIIDRKK